MMNDPVLHWQPIASAPRDEQVLVFSPRWGAMIATFRSDFGAWFSRMQCPAALSDDDIQLITHWMPLPLRPDISERVSGAAPTPAMGLSPVLARFLDRASAQEAA